MNTNWKDETGIRLREGDTVMLQEPGLDVLGKVEFMPDFGRHMLRTTHLRYKNCGDTWHPQTGPVKSVRNLDTRGHYPLSRRLRGVWMVERVDADRLGVNTQGGYAPMPLIQGDGWGYRDYWFGNGGRLKI